MDKKKKAKLAMDLGFVGTKSAAKPFKGADISGTKPFKGADISGTKPFKGADISGAKPFKGADISGAKPFKGADISGAKPFKNKEAMTKQTKKVPATMPFVTKTYLADPANSPKKYDYSKSKKENLKRIMPSAKDGALKKKKKSSYIDAILGN